MSEQPHLPEPDDILGSSVRQFIHATAARNPTPGGGSVAAIAGALSAALAQMALEYTVGKKQFEAHREELTGALEKLRKAAALMQELVSEDIAAYAFLSGFMKVPEAQREGRADYLTAVAGAIRAPQSVGGLALHILEVTSDLLDKTNPSLLSDLGIAAALAHATVDAAEYNVLVNLRLLADADAQAECRKKAEELSLKADILYRRVRIHMKSVL
jgi:formiminotetrahydrofolate cyclodeaminase